RPSSGRPAHRYSSAITYLTESGRIPAYSGDRAIAAIFWLRQKYFRSIPSARKLRLRPKNGIHAIF
ncbi:MAG: hypothetical protein LBG07_08175, partial [Treponema sp.]|nr:hypothetical protein [Treponema sp.]